MAVTGTNNNGSHIVANDKSHHALFGVPSATSEYKYQGRSHFENILHRECKTFEIGESSQYIIFSNVDEPTFFRDFTESLHHWFSAYIPKLKILLVKMVTEPHEVAHRTLDQIIILKLAGMNNLQGELFSVGRADYTSDDGAMRKSADAAYKPTKRSNEWPTLVLETGYSVSKWKLASDARWWLMESKGDVKTAVTIHVHPKKREINIETWTLVDYPTRTEKDPNVTQRVTISQSSAESAIKITKDSLVISFESLFLRPVGPSEGDIVLDKEDFEEIATKTWALHKNL